MQINRTSGPLVSTVTAVYNGESYIRDCLNAMLSQTYRNLEIIVVDDGSVDETAAIVRNEFPGRVKLIAQVNKKVAAARNNGMRHINGKYVAFCDQDDIWAPDKIEKQVVLLEQNPIYCLVHTDAEELNVLSGKRSLYSSLHPRITQFDTIFAGMIHSYAIPLFSTVMMRVESLNKYGIRFIDSAPGVDDIGVFLEMLMHGGEFLFINEPLVTRRMHDYNLSSDYLQRFQKRVILYSYLLERYRKAVKMSSITKRNFRDIKWGFSDAAYRTADYIVNFEKEKAKELYIKSWIHCWTNIRALIKYLIIRFVGLRALLFIKKYYAHV